MNELQPDELAEITELLQQGKKLAAVKRYKDLTGSRLGESKDAVEKLAESLSPGTTPRAALESKSGCFGMVLFLVTSLTAAAVCVFFVAGIF
ncbi:hypothetical protein FF011L_32270 [Roseimaritima multifibrata]|uniref:50S ribosomal protein L7/L12 n=1 Tax=Roseimaritima multifibrata TaxID=1930274 RepID=A0A517MHU3_9BACT|nr:hypothetical protein [Roseimaritima multifibrata]QDS94448.1 hypothetical protein FF011L_32270 [Roseimaritima multifibrata]